MDTRPPQDSEFNKFTERLHRSPLLKVAALSFFCLLLLIPISMVRDLLNERQNRQREASMEIASSWSQQQRFFGPVLMASAVYEKVAVRKERNGSEIVEREVTTNNEVWVCVLPDEYNFQTLIATEWRYRGIFRSPVYKAQISASGTWMEPDMGELGYASAKIDWSRTLVMYKVSDPRGMSDVKASVNGAQVPVSQGLRGPYEGVWTKLAHTKAETMPSSFELSLGLKGSEVFSLFPMGRFGGAEIASDWSTPSFFGAALPDQRQVGEDGFQASYRFSEFGRGLPQSWIVGSDWKTLEPKVSLSSVGVEFLESISGYRMVDRSLKYSLLLVGVIFGAFFLFEILARVGLHAMQYLLVGSSLVVFFLILLSLSEILPFGLAYLISSSATTLMIALYSWSVLNEWKRAGIITILLGLMFGTLYLVLRMQDYSLLAGSSLIFTLLAAAMFLTRNLDWRYGKKVVIRPR